MPTRNWAWHIALVLSVGLHASLLLQWTKQSVAGGAELGSSGVQVDLDFVSDGEQEVDVQTQAQPRVEPESEPEPEPEPEPAQVPELSKTEPAQLVSSALAASVTVSSISKNVSLGVSSTDTTRPVGHELIGQAGLKKDYLQSLRLLLQKSKRYPRKAQRKKQEGVVSVSFHVTAEGTVQELRLVDSSGLEVLDRAAIKLIERTAPFPYLPKELADEGLKITVPIAYQLK